MAKVDSFQFSRQDLEQAKRLCAPASMLGYTPEWINRLEAIFEYQRASKLYFTLEAIDFDDDETKKER